MASPHDRRRAVEKSPHTEKVSDEAHEELDGNSGLLRSLLHGKTQDRELETRIN